jgi:hypothetical protein
MTNLLVPSLVSSLLEVTMTQPLDVIKTYKQANRLNELNYSFKNLYKGFVPRALGNIPSRTTFLFTQEYLNSHFKYQNINKKHKSYVIPISVGFCQTLVDTPVEVMKINQIFNIKNKNYYSGFIPHCTRNIIFAFFVFNFKEYGKKYDSIVVSSAYGAVGGLVGCYLSHPFDTIKTIKQSQSNKKLITFSDYMKGSHLRASMGLVNMFVSLSLFEILCKYI